MNEEIKEILKYIDQFVYVDQTYNDIKLSKIDTKLILDYITNLQQENERLNQNNQSYQEEMARTWKIADNYKSRCEKANKIITDFMCTEEYCSVDPVAIAENYMEIQKALNGSDKSE